MQRNLVSRSMTQGLFPTSHTMLLTGTSALHTEVTVRQSKRGWREGGPLKIHWGWKRLSFCPSSRLADPVGGGGGSVPSLSNKLSGPTDYAVIAIVTRPGDRDWTGISRLQVPSALGKVWVQNTSLSIWVLRQRSLASVTLASNIW